MTTWLPVVVAIVAALGVGFLREHFRVSGVERWARAKGFVRRPSPFTPAPTDPPAMLTARLHPRGARVWGMAIDGMIDAAPCSVAEYAVTRVGTKSADDWFTLVWWHSPTGAGDASQRTLADGVQVQDGDYAGWRLPGALTADRLEGLVKRIPEARLHMRRG